MYMKKKTLLAPRKTKHKHLLTEELAESIKELIHKGYNLTDCARELDIKENTIRQWKFENTLDFADMVEKAQLERELIVAKEFSVRLLQMSETEEGKQNTRLLAIKQKESEFLRSNLINAKRMYDNRSSQNTVIVLPTPILGGMLEKENEVIPDKVE